MIRERKRLMLFTAAAVVAVAAALFVANKPKQGQEGVSANVAAVPQGAARVPPAPVEAAVTNITVKSIDGARREAEPYAEIAGDSTAAVRCIVGLDSATTTRYITRSRAIESLGKELPDSEIKALLAYLDSTDNNLRQERVAALKNDVMNLLRAQKSIPPDLAPALIKIFNAKRQDSVILDYCVQHLGALQEQLDDAAQLGAIYSCIRKASLDENASYSGTALVAMSHRKNPSDENNAFLTERAAAIATSPKSHEAARITAIMVASENGCEEILPAVREIVASAADSISLKIVAINALGRLGNDSDKQLLANILAADPNPRLAPALNKGMGNRECEIQNHE